MADQGLGPPRPKRELTEDEKVDVKLAKDFETMIHTDGWKAMKRWMDNRQMSLMQELVQNDVEGKDAAIKGAIRMLATITSLPETTIAQARKILGTSQEDDR